MARRKAKKKLSFMDKVKGHIHNAKVWTIEHVNDPDFLPAMTWILVGSMLVFKCVDPWVALGVASLLIGGKKLWEISRW
jgi:hypothetical protein